ncbi:hypothetical protein F2P56_030979 [Juglans regia]|uniref:phosphoenolpyruvate carboxykinase (ATP) n=2 Tax=Juglans regia TaxID=51240 RepID=A0A2I4H093_JUGRE|nr:uncharacterized protein LOC109012411 isoform X1 [Juglans regia]KAF5450647.1 hypothetical protein F2P56_030979 [Juglans regia]
MRNLVLKWFLQSSRSFTRPSSSRSSPFLLSSRWYSVSAPRANEEAETVVFPREGPGFSHGLQWALAAKGILVKENAFRNLESSELQQKGANIVDSLSGLPVYVRGSIVGGASEISKSQFGKLLKQVSNHISSISDVFVHDGAIGSSPKCDAKVRVISDSPSAVLSLSNVLWKTPTRAVSHDSCPLTVYVATSISPGVGDTVGLGAQMNKGFIAADIERSSLILCGKAFSDTNGIKEALASLSGPIISSRGGLPLSGRLLASGDSVVLLFAPYQTIESCTESLVSADAGVILSSEGVAPYFQSGKSGGTNLFKLPAAVILASSDSSGSIPSASKLSPGQAAYHFLAGYQNGKFLPAYSKGSSSIDLLELAMALRSKLQENQIPSFLINVNEGEKSVTGKDLVKLVESTLSKNIPQFEAKGGNLQGKYKSFLSGKFQDLPKEFSF